jgi:predicted hydrocarbon binding protein
MMNIIKRAFIKSAARGFAPLRESTLTMVGDLCKAFYEKNGEASLPILAEIASKSGLERAETIKKMTSVKDMKDIGELFKMMDLMMEMGVKIVELSNDTIHYKMPKCNLHIGGTSKELCETMMTADTKMFGSLLGQEVDMKILSSIAAGDKECEIIFSIK